MRSFDLNGNNASPNAIAVRGVTKILMTKNLY
jgi:hypothetical protein